ncbi:hypothetical protein BDR06DRAFT_1022169 [Suillus hirtellus]|nr:hypothetical protein BDR06DRAFT_1022169 [Suillus hirtellus]
MAAAPLNGTDDENLAVGYIAVFMLVWSITLFPLGGYWLMIMDYDGPDLDDDRVKERLSAKHSKILLKLTAGFVYFRRIFLFSHSPVRELHTEVGQNSTGEKESPHATSTHENFVTTRHKPPEQEEIGISILTNEELPTSPSFTSTQPGLALIGEAQKVSTTTTDLPNLPSGHVAMTHALFVAGVPGTHIPSAPDGQPPLAFLMKTSTFIGNASVPMGLIMLGSALARLNVPRNQWSSLPLCAIASCVIARLVVMPVLGTLICQQFTRVGLMDPSNNVLRFVCILVSGLPTASLLVFLTQVYSGTGNAEHLAAFLIPQYIIVFISMTAFTTLALDILFG